MTLHYLKSTIRYFRRTSAYSTLNITGLVLGMSASALLFVYVWDELRFDRFHANYRSTYRIITEQNNGSREVTTPGPLGDMLLEKYPQIDDMARVGKWSGTLKLDDKVYEENEVYFVDNSFFQIFDFELIKGDPAMVLKKPNDLLLTEKTAQKFFGVDWKMRSDVIGRDITLNGDTHFTVVGVVANPPSFSSIQFDYLLSFEYLKADRSSYNWGSHNFHTYVQLNENADIKALSVAINDGTRGTEFHDGFLLVLQPLQHIHMESFVSDDWVRHGSPQNTLAFAGIGTLILLIACFNYINLTTSQAVRRVKEIGIRKVNGAGRLQIFVQFMGESTLIVVLSAMIARAIVDLLLPYFNELAGKALVIETFQLEINLLFTILALVTSILAGIYPAITFANLKSVSLMKGIAKPASRGVMRGILVTAQFSISLVLISVTIMMFAQLRYMENRDLGFNSDELVYIKLAGSLRNNNESFKTDLRSLSYVQAATRTTSTLVNTDNGGYVEWPGKKEGQEITITQMNVDADFIPSLNVEMLAGRPFATNDSSSYILNETALKAMGLEIKDALGMKIKFWGTEGEVIGVARDFHFRPMHYGITPLILRHSLKENFYQLLVKVDHAHLGRFKREASTLFTKYEPNFPFSFGIIDESIRYEYRSEQRVSSVATIFSGLAIVISLLGVLGLVSNAIEERSKEFSIRKVLGLHLGHLLAILSQRLVFSYVVSMIIATPISYIIISKWIENFSYRTSINVESFVVSYLLVFALASCIILFQSLQQIRKRTIDALRSE